MKACLLASGFGISRAFKGGPGIYAWSLKKSLDLVGIETEVYYQYGEVDPFYLSENCHHIPGGIKLEVDRDKNKIEGRYKTEIDEYDIYHVLSSENLAYECNKAGIEPLIGPNIIPNSSPSYCVKYLSPAEVNMRREQILHEQSLIQILKGRFWLHQSMWQRTEFERLGLVDVEKNCRQLHNGVDTDLFTLKDEKTNEILWSGRDWWPKQPKIFAGIAKNLPDEKFIAFSDGLLPFNLPNVKIVMGLCHYQVAPRLNGKIFLNCSSTENESLAILEAMSCGIPVIVTSVSGNPEIVDHGKTGFLYDIEKPEQAVKYINLLSEDENLRDKIGKEARKYIEDNFSFKCMGENAKKLYEEARS